MYLFYLFSVFDILDIVMNFRTSHNAKQINMLKITWSNDSSEAIVN